MALVGKGTMQQISFEQSIQELATADSSSVSPFYTARETYQISAEIASRVQFDALVGPSEATTSVVLASRAIIIRWRSELALCSADLAF